MEFGDEGGFELAEPPMAMAAPAAAPKIEKTSAVAEPISMPAEPVPAAPAVPSRGPKDAPPATRGVYFVRIPRPAVTTDDATIKKLQAELASIVGQLRELNKQHMTKRGEASELRRQLKLARSLRDGASPDYGEKAAHLQQLNKMRGDCVRQIVDLKSQGKGLEVRSEAELDARIQEMEHRIQHDSLPLREEKQLVQAISKLNAQRAQVCAAEAARAGMADLESEADKLKALINELDKEFSVVRGERKEAQGLIGGISDKLNGVMAELKDIEAEQAELTAAKDEAAAALDAARSDGDGEMGEFRANRKFSAQVRDMVAAGRVEEAKAACEEQVDAMIGKLVSDASYRAAYCALWNTQRKAAVSVLLPHTYTPEPGAEASSASSGPGPAGRAGGKAKAPPPKPQGEAKARAIIAAVMQEAGAAGAAARGRDFSADSDDDGFTPTAAPSVAKYQPPSAGRPVPGAGPATAEVKRPAAASVSAKVDYSKYLEGLPTAPYDDVFVPPTPAAPTRPVLSAAELSAKLREENRRKQEEAEARKARKAEAAARKKARAAERKQEEREKASTRQDSPAAVDEPSARAVAPEPGTGDASTTVVIRRPEAAKPRPAKPAKHAPIMKAGTATVGLKGSRPPRKDTALPDKATKLATKAWRMLRQQQVVVAVVALLLVAMVLLSGWSNRQPLPAAV